MKVLALKPPDLWAIGWGQMLKRALAAQLLNLYLIIVILYYLELALQKPKVKVF